MRQRIVVQQKTFVQNGKQKVTEFPPNSDEARLANPDLVESPEKPLETPEMTAVREMMEDGVERLLTPAQLVVYRLLIEDGLSMEDTASKLGVSKGAIQSRFELVKKKLRKMCYTKLMYE